MGGSFAIEHGGFTNGDLTLGDTGPMARNPQQPFPLEWFAKHIVSFVHEMGTHTEHLPRIRNSVTEPRSRPGTEPRSPHSRRSDLSTAGCRPCEHEDLMETYGPNMEIPPNHPSDKFSIEIESHGDLGIPISKPKNGMPSWIRWLVKAFSGVACTASPPFWMKKIWPFNKFEHEKTHWMLKNGVP